MRKRKGSKTIKSAVFFGSVRLAAAVTLGILALLLLFILVKGVPHLSLKFLAESPENMGKEGGIFPVLIGTVYVTLTSVLIAMPLGVAAAVYFSEYAGKGRLIHIIRFFTEVLAGIPSIIFGLFGFAFFVVFLGMGWSVIAGGITLSMMILPTLIRSTEEALKTVPGAYREGSLSLGATKWQTVVKVILPCCRFGILTGPDLQIERFYLELVL